MKDPWGQRGKALQTSKVFPSREGPAHSIDTVAGEVVQMSKTKIKKSRIPPAKFCSQNHLTNSDFNIKYYRAFTFSYKILNKLNYSSPRYKQGCTGSKRFQSQSVFQHNFLMGTNMQSTCAINSLHKIGRSFFSPLEIKATPDQLFKEKTPTSSSICQHLHTSTWPPVSIIFKHSTHPCLPSQVQPRWKPRSNAFWLAIGESCCPISAPGERSLCADLSHQEKYEIFCIGPGRIHYVGCSELGFKHANPFSAAVLGME